MVVAGSTTTDAMALVIRRWVAALPPGTAEVAEEHLRYDHVVHVRPTRPGAGGLEFRLSGYGRFDLYFGRYFRCEELDWSDTFAIEVLEAVAKGFREQIWEWRGRTLRTESELKLLSGEVLYDRTVGCPRWFGKKRVVEYRAWT